MILSHISVTYFPLEILGHSPLTLCNFVTMHLGHYFIISRVSEAVQFFRRWRHHPSFGRLVVVAWLPTFLELSNNRQLSVLLIIIQIFIYSALSMITLFFLCLYWHSLMDAWMLSVEGAVGVRGVNCLSCSFCRLFLIWANTSPTTFHGIWAFLEFSGVNLFLIIF